MLMNDPLKYETPTSEIWSVKENFKNVLTTFTLYMLRKANSLKIEYFYKLYF